MIQLQAYGADADKRFGIPGEVSTLSFPTTVPIVCRAYCSVKKHFLNCMTINSKYNYADTGVCNKVVL